VHTVAAYGGNYDHIIAAAHKSGYAFGQLQLKNTFYAFPIAFGALGYGVITAYMGGEVRNARRTMVISMVAALVIGTLLGAVMMALSVRTFGSDSLGSATVLSNAGSSAYPFASPSSYFLWVSLLSHSSVVQVIIMVCAVAALVATLPPGYLIVTRSMFAWSFDRVMPTKLSDVDPRTHAPIWANVVTLVVGVAFLAFLVFGNKWVTELLFTVAIGQAYSFVLIAFAGVVFPWRRPDLYKASPLRRSVLGVPAFSLISLAAGIVYGLALVLLLTNNALGANGTPGMIATAVIGAAAVLIWPVSYFVNRSRGIDLHLAFGDLPPE
jgi:basic amino acid/polyamine antiporter, APA family